MKPHTINPAIIAGTPIRVYFRLTEQIATEHTLDGEKGCIYTASLCRKDGGCLTYYSQPYVYIDGWSMVDRPWCNLEKADLYPSFQWLLQSELTEDV